MHDRMFALWQYTTNMHVMGKVLYNRLQEKKDETCSEEQVMKIQDSLQ